MKEVEVSVEVLKTKELDVRVKTTGEPKAGYAIASVDYQPTSILVVGEAADLAKVDEVVIDDIDVTDLAKDWEGDDRKAFTGIVKKMMALIGVLTVAACIGAYLLGIPVLSLIYGVDLSSYRLELVVVMICGGLNAYVYCLYYVVTVTGKQIYLLAGYGVGLAAAALFDPILVQRAGIMGAAVCCTLSFALVFAVFLLITAVVIRKKKTILN